jgi:hypothetical protein
MLFTMVVSLLYDGHLEFIIEEMGISVKGVGNFCWRFGETTGKAGLGYHRSPADFFNM